METDIASVSACRTLINDAADRFGRLDILVNVAAILQRQTFPMWRSLISSTSWTSIYEANSSSAKPPYHLWPRPIGAVSSTSRAPAGFIGARYSTTSYAVSKAGLLGLTRSLARQYGGANICVNLVSPGGIDTPMGRQALEGEDQVAFLRTIPMGRLAQPREIAYGALFLVSEWARYVNGHVLVVDGAATMHA